MRDLRDVLDDAAGSPPDLPDIDMIRRRARPMLVRRRAGAAFAAVALVAGLAGVASVLGDSVPGRGDQVVQPSPTPEPHELRPGQLEPGTYDGRVGAFNLTLALGNDDWKVLVNDDTWLVLTYRQYALHFQVWGSVVPAASPNVRGSEPVPGDIAAWLAANDRVTTTAGSATEVGGVPATEVVVRVARPLDRSPAECATSRCVVLARVAGDGELVHVEQGERARFLVVGDPGAQLVVTYRAPEDELAALDQAVARLLAGLRLTAVS